MGKNYTIVRIKTGVCLIGMFLTLWAPHLFNGEYVEEATPLHSFTSLHKPYANPSLLESRTTENEDAEAGRMPNPFYTTTSNQCAVVLPKGNNDFDNQAMQNTGLLKISAKTGKFAACRLLCC